MGAKHIVIPLLIIALLGGALFGAIRYGGVAWNGVHDFYLDHEPQFLADLKNNTRRVEAAKCIEDANLEVYVAELGIVETDVYVSFLFKSGQKSTTNQLLSTISGCVLEHIPAVQEMNMARLIVVEDEGGQFLGVGLVIYLIVARPELEGLRDAEDPEEYFLLGTLQGTIQAECPACYGGIPTPWKATPEWDYHYDEAVAEYAP